MLTNPCFPRAQDLYLYFAKFFIEIKKLLFPKNKKIKKNKKNQRKIIEQVQNTKGQRKPLL